MWTKVTLCLLLTVGCIVSRAEMVNAEIALKEVVLQESGKRSNGLEEDAAQSRRQLEPVREDSIKLFTAEYQLDTRGFNSFQLFGSSSLPYSFNIVGSFDFESPISSEESRYDLSTFFYEIGLTRKFRDGLGYMVEANDFNGLENDIYRIGLFYIPPWAFLKAQHLFVFTKVLPVESDGRGGQFSIAWNKSFPHLASGRLSISGFVDFNYDSGINNDEQNIISDVQFIYRLYGGLHFLTEFRYNQFKLPADEFGVGVGFKNIF